MSAGVSHEAAVADLPENAEGNPFFFSLQSDDSGVTELKFRKDVSKLFSTLLFAMEYINGSFDEPFPTTSAFIHELGNIADKVESALVQREASNDQEGTEGTEAAT